MTSNVDTVKIPRRGAAKSAAKPAGYHHGDLRAALIAAAEAVIAERGIDGFSLRETARRAGVSPAAPQHHFGDARGLLTAVATEGFLGLAAALEAADADAADPRQRIHRQGAAYVRFALSQPARFDVMWRKSRIDGGNAAYAAAGDRAYRLLTSAVADADPEAGEIGAVAAWSLVHGFARLALDGVFGAGPGAAEAAAEAMLDSLMARLR